MTVITSWTTPSQLMLVRQSSLEGSPAHSRPVSWQTSSTRDTAMCAMLALTLTQTSSIPKVSLPPPPSPPPSRSLYPSLLPSNNCCLHCAGAGRVTFSSRVSFMSAVSCRFLQVTYGDIDKKVTKMCMYSPLVF